MASSLLALLFAAAAAAAASVNELGEHRILWSVGCDIWFNVEGGARGTQWVGFVRGPADTAVSKSLPEFVTTT